MSLIPILQSLMCYGKKQSDIGLHNIRFILHPLEVFIKKNLSTLQSWRGLGLVATSIGSCVLPRLVQKYRNLLCYGQKQTDIGAGNIKLILHPLEVLIKENLSSLQLWRGLGLVATPIGSFVLPRLVQKYRNLLCYGQKQTDIGPPNIRLVLHPLEVFIKENLSTLQLGPGLGLVATAFGSCVLPRLVQKYRNRYLMARSRLILAPLT